MKKLLNYIYAFIIIIVLPFVSSSLGRIFINPHSAGHHFLEILQHNSIPLFYEILTSTAFFFSFGFALHYGFPKIKVSTIQAVMRACLVLGVIVGLMLSLTADDFSFIVTTLGFAALFVHLLEEPFTRLLEHFQKWQQKQKKAKHKTNRHVKRQRRR